VKPLCMDDAEYALWDKANRAITAASSRAKRPCSDCPLSYYHQMRSENRCDGVPKMRIKKTPDERRMQLRVMWKAAAARRRARAKAAAA
jgi:hypothetical protein